MGVIIFILFKYGINWRAIDIEYGALYLPGFILFSLPSLFSLSVKALLEIPKLSFAPYSFESVEDAIGVKFDGLKGVVWIFDDITNQPFEYRTRVNKERLNETLGELFRQVVALNNFDPHRKYSIPFNDNGKPIEWRFDLLDAGNFSKGKKQLDPLKKISSFFFFKSAPKGKYGNIKKVRTIHVTHSTN